MAVYAVISKPPNLKAPLPTHFITFSMIAESQLVIQSEPFF
jgi:hypothetical protein